MKNVTVAVVLTSRAKMRATRRLSSSRKRETQVPDPISARNKPKVPLGNIAKRPRPKERIKLDRVTTTGGDRSM